MNKESGTTENNRIINNPANKTLGSIVGCSSHIGSKTINEDAFRIERIGSVKSVIVSDGVGSSLRADEAAQIVVKAFGDIIKKTITEKRGISFPTLKSSYKYAVNKLMEVKSQNITKPELQTTVIAAIETRDSFFISYLGNGMIWLRRGDGYAIPLMVPHESGSLLTGVLTPEGITSKPVFIEYSKSFASGEMLIIGSDGLSEIEGGYRTIAQEIMSLLRKNKPFNNDDLNKLLQEMLESFNNKSAFIDNTTLGVIITEKMLFNLYNSESM